MDRLRSLLRGVFSLNFFFGVFTFVVFEICFLRFLSWFGSVSELINPDGDFRVEIPIRYLSNSVWLRCCVLIIYLVCGIHTRRTDGYVFGLEVFAPKMTSEMKSRSPCGVF